MLKDHAQPGFGPALYEGLREAANLIWMTTGPALVAAALAYLTVLNLTVHLCRWRQGGLSRSDQRDVQAISLLTAIAVWITVQGRQYLWSHYRHWIVVLGLLLTGGLVALVWAAQVRSARLSRHRLGRLATAEGLRRLTPREFELACAELFRSLGYQVKVTPLSNDRGADLAIIREGVRGIVECKHYLGERKVSGPDLQKLLGAREYYRATEAYLVTSGELTEAAWDVLRHASGLQVWRQGELTRKLAQVAARESTAD